MRKICLFVFIFGGFLASNAQLLWKISGNGLKNPSYIFGTHHLIPISFLDSVPELYKSFNACEMIVCELISNNLDATSKIQQAAIMPNHIKMKDLFGDKEYKLVDDELKSVLKFGLTDVAIMNPALILTLYELEVYKKTTGFSDDIKSDTYFQLVGVEKGKKIEGLETVDEQIEILFGNNNFQRQADILHQIVLHKDSSINEMLLVNKLYKAGKIQELVKMAQKTGGSLQFSDTEYYKFADARNLKWFAKLPTMMNQQSCFVAVGAMHLGGNNGLLQLFKNAGYKLTAMY